MNKKFILSFSILSLFGLSTLQAQQKSYLELLENQPKWIDSVFNKLSAKQKIAQLFFVRAHTNRGTDYADSVGKVIRKERLGGAVFFQGGPARQAVLANQYQQKAKVPLLFASDGEWGLGMRLDSTLSYPYQMALGAIKDNRLLYQMGIEVAKDFKRVGMHFNLAPDVDINNNAKNPVINFRSFGENKYNVAEKSAAYLMGMQDGNLLTSIKHFPGHGDTEVDSHYGLPQINFSKERLDTLELYPFKTLIKKGASGVMVAHMNIPALDNTPNLPSSLSKPIITDLLKNQLGFKGIVISDAMNMKGVANYYKDGDADVLGIMAGLDIIELSENSKLAVKKIRKAIKAGKISQDRIDESVRKVLTAKYWVGLNQQKLTDTTNIHAELNRPESIQLIQELANASMTLVKGKDGINSLDLNKTTLLINIGSPEEISFQKELKNHYRKAKTISLDKNLNSKAADNIIQQLKGDEQIILSIIDSRGRPGNNIPLGADAKELIKVLSARGAKIAFFANPYNLANIPGIEMARSILVAYQKEDFMQHAAAQVFLKQITTSGKLPVSVNQVFKYGDGL
jgi:beta-glucosidase-like glycosyl hydrolase